MTRLIVAALAATALSAPAIARDGSGYVGLDAGILFPRHPGGGSAFADFTTVNVPTGVVGTPLGPIDTEFDNPLNLNLKTGVDADILGGYDFGMFRLEGEIGYKRSHLNSAANPAFLVGVNAALNRPSVAPDPAAPGLPALVSSDFRLDDEVHVWSAMINGLVDFGGEGGVGGYIGAGAGYGKVHFADTSDGKFAWQILAGLYFPVSSNIDIGLKGRYFQIGGVNTSDTLAFAGNPNRLAVGTPPVIVDQTTGVILSTQSHEKFQAFSVLASLVYNFSAPLPPPAPPPPPPAPPPPLPTQSCPDGSVIAATDTCPAPPPPPPAPAPAPERG